MRRAVQWSSSFAYGKNGKACSYYIAIGLKLGRRSGNEGAPRRISASLLDHSLCERLRCLTGRHDLGAADLRSLIERVELHARATHVIDAALLTSDSPRVLLDQLRQRLAPGEQATSARGGAIRIVLRPSTQLRGGRTWMEGVAEPRLRSPLNLGLVEALRSSHLELRQLKASPLTASSELSSARLPETHHRRQLARLPFLAPDLQAMILEGRQPAHINLRQLLKTELPLAWSDQRVLFGMSESFLDSR